MSSDNSPESVPDSDEHEQNFQRRVHPRRPSLLPAQESMITYSMTRSKVTTLRGRRIHFQLSLNDDPLYHTKLLSTTQKEAFPISKGTVTHYSSDKELLLLHSKDNSAYSLRSGDLTGEEVLSIDMHQITTVAEPKIINVVFKGIGGTPPVHLIAKKPTQNEEGQYILDFHERYITPSIKNAILVVESTGAEAMLIRKVGPDEMEIDCDISFPPQYVFSIGLSMWLCPF